MNLGIVADEIDRDFAKAVRTGTALGIRRYEIRHLLTGRFPCCSLEELREIERIIETEDIEVTGLSPGLFKLTDTPAEFETAMREVYPRSAEWAHRWNLPGFIVFGFHKPGATEQTAVTLPREPAPNHIIEWLSRAAEQASHDKLQLMIEPELVCWADSASSAVAMIERTGSGALRINYDPGNVAWLEQRDPIAEFDIAASLIANVHVKNLLPSEPGLRPTFVPVNEGLIDFRAHFTALRRVAYTGPISLEPHMDGKPETIRQCKEAVEQLWEQSA